MRNWMKSLGALLPLLRYMCAVAPDVTGDPTFSTELAFGGGSFAEVSRDCNGNVIRVKDHPYSEVGGKVSARFSEFTIGVAGGRTDARLEQKSSPAYGYMDGYATGKAQSVLNYVTPSVGLETEPVGLEVGLLCSMSGQTLGWPGAENSRQSFSGALRLGKRDKFHFSAGYARNVPLISGGGLIDAGFSFPLTGGRSSLWLGLGAEPYDGLVFSCKSDIGLTEYLAITPRVGFKSGDATEYGYAVGLRVSF
jgi:hypothetical protein